MDFKAIAKDAKSVASCEPMKSLKASGISRWVILLEASLSFSDSDGRHHQMDHKKTQNKVQGIKGAQATAEGVDWISATPSEAIAPKPQQALYSCLPCRNE
jgi:hypothetical protein